MPGRAASSARLGDGNGLLKQLACRHASEQTATGTTARTVSKQACVGQLLACNEGVPGSHLGVEVWLGALGRGLELGGRPAPHRGIATREKERVEL